MKRPIALHNQTNPQAVRDARRVCRLVESGEVMSVAWVAVTRGGQVQTSWSTGYRQNIHLQAGVATLAHRMAQSEINAAESA